MELIVLFGSFAVLLLLGVPVAFTLGVSALITVVYMGLPPMVVFQRMAAGMNVFALMAIPFFIYAGELMLRGGIADRLVQLANAAIGHIRGGLGLVNVLASMLFGGISGSAVADASALGSTLIPMMRPQGLRRRLRGQRHGDLGDHRAGDPAEPQHDHLLHRRRGQRLGRLAVHGRHRPRPC